MSNAYEFACQGCQQIIYVELDEPVSFFTSCKWVCECGYETDLQNTVLSVVSPQDWIESGPNMLFTVQQVEALLGGSFPTDSGFAWERVHSFRLIGDQLYACDGSGELLPAPSIKVMAKTVEDRMFASEDDDTEPETNDEESLGDVAKKYINKAFDDARKQADRELKTLRKVLQKRKSESTREKKSNMPEEDKHNLSTQIVDDIFEELSGRKQLFAYDRGPLEIRKEIRQACSEIVQKHLSVIIGATVVDMKETKEKALEVIFQYGGIDGAYHKQWVMDQLVRILADDYERWVEKYESGEDGPQTYWDEGIAAP